MRGLDASDMGGQQAAAAEWLIDFADRLERRLPA
jgi:hypothetical protein